MKHNYTDNWKQLDFGITAAAIGAGAALAGTGGQIGATSKLNRKTRQWNEKMYGIQRADALKDWNAQNQYNSPEEQMKRLKAAGLNPALMYGGGPQPGGITQPTRGASPGSWNPETPNIKGMGIEVMQAAMIKAQIDNMNADTNKKTVEATKIGGVDTDLAKTTISSLAAGIDNTEAKTALTKIEADIATVEKEIAQDTKWTVEGRIQKEMEKISNETDLLVRQKHITAATQDAVIGTAKANLAGILVANELHRVQTKLTTEQIGKVKQEIINLIQQKVQADDYLQINWGRLGQEARKIALDQSGNFDAEGLIKSVLGLGIK